MFAELKRRNVFRVAAMYAVAAWLLIQIGEATFDALGLPQGSLRFLIIAVGAGSESIWPILRWLGILMVVCAIAWWVVWFVSAHLWVKLTISNKRTVRHEGIVRRHTSEVLHDHVRNVEIRQSFWQRLLKVGYVGISSSGQDGIEIEVRDIPRPYELKALIDEYRDM